MAERVTILVVGNHAVRAAVRSILETDGRLLVLGEADDGDEAVQLYRARPAHVVVICQRNAEGDSLETARQIGEEAPDARIIVLGCTHTILGGVRVGGSYTRAVRTEAAHCLTGVAVELGRR